MDILGISAFYHDSAACVVRDGMVLAAAQEERFTRKKQDAGFPGHAIRYCLQEAHCAVRDLTYFVFYDKPLVKFGRLLETYLAFAPRGRRSFVTALPVWLKEKLFLKSMLCKGFEALAGLKKAALPPLLFTEHHEAHAASAFFPSPFQTAAVLCMDGVGEWATTSAWLGQDNQLTPLWDIPFPHSLGLLYSAFTYYTGFKVNSGEYKVMGLAPYGQPKYVQTIYDHLLDLKRDGPFQGLWIQPAAGDAGGAVGAALAAWHQFEAQPRLALPAGWDGMQGAFLGPAFSNAEIEQFLQATDAPYVRLSDAELYTHIAEELAAEKVIGWFQGRMEFGPRALGARSILGDARSPKMQSVMNLKIKYRESLRPFAPSVLRERVGEYFEMDADSPYMLLVAPVVESRRTAMTAAQQALWGIELLNVPRSDIPAVTHVDYSARIQTVHADTNPHYYRLLKAFEAKTGYGVMVNTSFNVRGEPIVCTPEDAYRCFMRTEIDTLVLGNCVLDKIDQKPLVEDTDWRK